MNKNPDTDAKNPIQVADRLFQTIELLAKNGSMGLMDMSYQLGLNKSTMHRVLNSLIYMGYVRQDADNGRYELTYKIVRLSDQIVNNKDVVAIVRPYLQKLMEISGETVHFVEREGVEAVYIDKVESHSNSIQMVSRIGNKIPLYCSGVGKAIAAQLSEMEVQELWKKSTIKRLTPYTITQYDEFIKCLREVREQGYALDNEENETGVRCIAASVMDHRGQTKYAFSISAPVNRMDNDRIRMLAEYVLNTREQLRREFQ